VILRLRSEVGDPKNRWTSAPVWVDTITGGVYAVPEEKVVVEAGKVIFQDIPVYDAPTFITDKSLLTLVPSNH
jgi:hypothetical protein